MFSQRPEKVFPYVRLKEQRRCGTVLRHAAGHNVSKAVDHLRLAD